ncbi:MAG: hypothetical protein AAF511_12320 [Pseudomonadota bacterium]
MTITKDGTATPKTCTACGQILSSPLNYNGPSWVKAGAPTPVEDGVIPAFIIARPRELIMTIQFYTELGCRVADISQPERKKPDHLDLRLDWFSKAGGLFFGSDLKPLNLHANSIEETLGDDPRRKWFSDWPNRAKARLIKQAPHDRLFKRLQAIDVALRCPPCWYAG